MHRWIACSLPQCRPSKAYAEADAKHRETLAVTNERRQAIAAQTSVQLLELLERNTQLRELTKALTGRIELLAVEVHAQVASVADLQVEETRNGRPIHPGNG
ncbi:hypothetical protein D9M72_342460 [compost metagenome]